MAWGPQGETKRVERKVTRDELEIELAQNYSKGLWEFIRCIQPEDELTFEAERNNHRGFERYVGRTGNGLTYCYVISSFMS